MKNILILLLTLLLAFNSILLCEAEDSNTIDIWWETHWVTVGHLMTTYDEYEEGVNKWFSGVKDFVHYEQISALGEFRSFWCDPRGAYPYYYNIIIDGGEKRVKLSSRDNMESHPYILFRAFTKKEYPNLRQLDCEDDISGIALLVNEAIYVYKRQTSKEHLQLASIILPGKNNTCFQLDCGGSIEYTLADCGLKDKNSLLSRLLKSSTAEAAVKELRARLAGTYVEPTPAWVLPTAICGGAVVLAAAVAVPTVILRRKKRKAAAAADGAPAPDEGECV